MTQDLCPQAGSSHLHLVEVHSLHMWGSVCNIAFVSFSGPLVVEKLITYSEAPWKEFSRGSLVLQELGAWGWAPFALSGLALPPDAWALPPRQQELGLPGKTECVNSGPQEGLLCLCVGFSQSED